MNNETHTRTPHRDVFLYQRALLLVWPHCMTLLYCKNGQDAFLLTAMHFNLNTHMENCYDLFGIMATHWRGPGNTLGFILGWKNPTDKDRLLLKHQR